MDRKINYKEKGIQVRFCLVKVIHFHYSEAYSEPCQLAKI